MLLCPDKTSNEPLLPVSPPAEHSEPITYTAKEHFILAATIWGEARGEGTRGMRAVAHVIVNRAKRENPAFGHGIRGVAMKRHQFACWSLADLKKARLDGLDPSAPDGRAWRQAVEIADHVLSGRDSDPTHGAVYYHARQVNPIWNRNLEQVAVIGSHLFYI